MQTSIIIVDDFLNNPEEVRRQALALDYPDQKGIFPGRNSLQRLQIDGLSQVVSHLVGEPLVPAPPNQSHAKCRLTTASDQGLGRVHIDVSDWSGILYLSKREDCVGGTEFFRHKRTGWDRFPEAAASPASTRLARFWSRRKAFGMNAGSSRCRCRCASTACCS